MSKYIVTGTAGFIGSHITERLLRDGHEVVGVDDLSTGLLENLAGPLKNKKFTLVNLDISDWTKLTRNFSYFEGADGLFHLAALSRIQPSIFNPSRTHEINVNGTFNVLEMMRMMKVNKVVYSASSSSYGLKNKTPLKENMVPDCLTPYAATKYQAEIYCKTWGNLYGIRNVCLKYFNVYGARSPLFGQYAPVVGIFFRQLLQENTPMTVVGNGQQRRDMTYIDDVVNANMRAMDVLSGKEWESASGQTINIGTGMNYSVVELAEKIRDILVKVKPDAKYVFTPERPGEAMVTLADITLAKKLLKWSPQVTLDEGLRVLKDYYLDVVFK
jgi:nucleoside-diphosphate-sugar epimerase